MFHNQPNGIVTDDVILQFHEIIDQCGFQDGSTITPGPMLKVFCQQQAIFIAIKMK